MNKKALIASVIALPFLGMFFAGCANTQGNTISKDEVNRLVQAPKLQATEVDGDLKYLSSFKGTPTHLLGKVTEIQHPQFSYMPDGEKFEWVPIMVEVESSNQPQMSSHVLLRLYPLADQNDSLLRLSIGDEIIALASKLSKTETGLSVYTLGSLYKVLPDNSIVQFDTRQTVEGTSDEFLSLLGLH
jgi:hypothetical protein